MACHLATPFARTPKPKLLQAKFPPTLCSPCLCPSKLPSSLSQKSAKKKKFYVSLGALGRWLAAVDTTGRVYDDFSRLLFLHAHREASALGNEIPEESDQFRFLRVSSYTNIKGSVGLILAKTSSVRISVPLDLSSRPFIPLSRFICRRSPLPLLTPSLVFTPQRSP